MFNTYINDLPESPKTQLVIFADDTAILTSSWSPTYLKKYLQACLNSLQNFFQDWKIKLNPTKSEAIIFHRKKPSNFKYPPSVKICSIDTHWENKVKYLGIIIDHAIKWRPAIEDKRIKTYIPLRKLYSLPANNSSLPLRLKKLLYLTCVRPILIYGVQLWGGVTHTTLNRLQVVQNTYLRLIYKKKGQISNSKLHSLADISLLKETILIYSTNTIHLIQNHQDPLLKRLGHQTETKSLTRLKFTYPPC